MSRNTPTAVPVESPRASALAVDSVIPLVFVVLPTLSISLAVHLQAWVLCWLVPFAWFLLIPAADGRRPSVAMAHAAEEGKNDPRHVEAMVVIVGIVTTFFCVLQLEQVAAPGWAAVGASLALAIAWLIALQAAHDLLHRSGWLAAAIAPLPFALLASPHFRIDHVLGHHHAAATPADPVSARMGENYYKYCARLLLGTFRRARVLEARRLAKASRPMRLLRNHLVRDFALFLAAVASVLIWGGVFECGVMLIAGATAWWLWTAAGYVEHYGLLRDKRDDGQFERLRPGHAWQTGDGFSRRLLFRRSCHAHHHMSPGLPCEQLSEQLGSPTVQIGPGWLALLVLFPPLWFRIMDPILAEHLQYDLSRSNIDGDAYVRLMERYHRHGIGSYAIGA